MLACVPASQVVTSFTALELPCANPPAYNSCPRSRAASPLAVGDFAENCSAIAAASDISVKAPASAAQNVWPSPASSSSFGTSDYPVTESDAFERAISEAQAAGFAMGAAFAAGLNRPHEQRDPVSPSAMFPSLPDLFENVPIQSPVSIVYPTVDDVVAEAEWDLIVDELLSSPSTWSDSSFPSQASPAMPDFSSPEHAPAGHSFPSIDSTFADSLVPAATSTAANNSFDALRSYANLDFLDESEQATLPNSIDPLDFVFGEQAAAVIQEANDCSPQVTEEDVAWLNAIVNPEGTLNPFLAALLDMEMDLAHSESSSSPASSIASCFPEFGQTWMPIKDAITLPSMTSEPALTLPSDAQPLAELPPFSLLDPELACMPTSEIHALPSAPSIESRTLTSAPKAASPAARNVALKLEAPVAVTKSAPPRPQGPNADEIYANILKTVPESDGSFACAFATCDRRFARRYNLKTHFAAAHCDIREFRCTECKRAPFARKYDLIRHLEKHRRYQCVNCDAAHFASALEVEEHRAKAHKRGKLRHRCAESARSVPPAKRRAI
ncbi:hypothetical protein HDU87_006353 [Geranomyces variabilis]|uniref:C2H2-type domain-containing protein n=1 Tax=Geranomyces variabilis TaxID=109894 RepID=A0AAD5TG81_9FUNG|nr:hypothetical protein HDU87_006353 [Geranomyces variabilis]